MTDTSRLLTILVAVVVLVVGLMGGALILFRPNEKRETDSEASVLDLRLIGLLQRPQDLTSLKYVDGSREITDELCASIARIPHLEQLNAMESAISDDGIELLTRSGTLKTLCLRDTNVTDQSVYYLRDLESIETLDIGGTQITESGISELAKISSLRELILYDIHISDKGICDVSETKNLSSLVVDIVHITSEGIRCLSRMTELRRLTLAGRPLTAVEIEMLANMRNLKFLSFRTDILPEQMNALSKVKALEELELGPRPFTIDFDALLKLATLRRLRRLTVQPYIFKPTERQKLAATFPGVRIIGGD